MLKAYLVPATCFSFQFNLIGTKKDRHKFTFVKTVGKMLLNSS